MHRNCQPGRGLQVLHAKILLALTYPTNINESLNFHSLYCTGMQLLLQADGDQMGHKDESFQGGNADNFSDLLDTSLDSSYDTPSDAGSSEDHDAHSAESATGDDVHEAEYTSSDESHSIADSDGSSVIDQGSSAHSTSGKSQVDDQFDTGVATSNNPTSSMETASEGDHVAALQDDPTAIDRSLQDTHTQAKHFEELTKAFVSRWKRESLHWSESEQTQFIAQVQHDMCESLQSALSWEQSTDEQLHNNSDADGADDASELERQATSTYEASSLSFDDESWREGCTEPVVSAGVGEGGVEITDVVDATLMINVLKALLAMPHDDGWGSEKMRSIMREFGLVQARFCYAIDYDMSLNAIDPGLSSNAKHPLTNSTSHWELGSHTKKLLRTAERKVIEIEKMSTLYLQEHVSGHNRNTGTQEHAGGHNQ